MNRIRCLFWALVFVQVTYAYRGDLFASKLLESVVLTKANENVVYSPVAIETAVAMLISGATDATESEIRQAIGFETETKEEIGNAFRDFIDKTFNTNKDNIQLKMANALTISDKVYMKPELIQFINDKFYGNVQPYDFTEANTVAGSLNDWIGNEVIHKYQNAITPKMISADTIVLLVNAIHFKGIWATPFEMTEKSAFFVSPSQKVEIDMMYVSDDFKYGEFAELDATAIQIPYKDADLSMLIILPKQYDGLHALEQKIAKGNLKDYVSKMHTESTEVHLPQFKVKSYTNMKQYLVAMGVSKIFSSQTNGIPVVTDLLHITNISVDEIGTEAYTGSVAKAKSADAPLETKQFKADHPFVFAIMDHETIYFAGHIANF